jgi:N-methylhydantoinase B
LTASEIKWDGRTYPYVPSDELSVHPSLRLHTEVAPTVDPIDHEVLRHALWNVNREHGNTLIKASGSPICSQGHDFNPALLDERGGFVFFGPFLQYLSAATATGVKWTLENRSENPGIGPGDIFMFNDPWIGITHQADLGVIAPVFVDGALFCWVGNSLQMWDNGGTGPGGFAPTAQDVFWEAPCIPPVKVVEAGVLRRDIEEYYTRTSRLPDLVALDLRALIAGCRVAVERIGLLVERYGAGAVKATMRKLQDDAEAAFVRRLATIPDGSWTEDGWIEISVPGDRGIYRNRVTLTKRGDRLIFSNAGTAPQDGTLSMSLGAWKGSVTSALNTSMLFDQMLCIEGALRHCDFEVTPGTLSCATHPAAISGAPAAVMQSIGLGGIVLSKMLATSTDEELRTEATACMGEWCSLINALNGLDQRGNPYTAFLLDLTGAAGGAASWRDGQDTGGWTWDLQSTMPNVEDNELFYPILYLWRRELADSGGAGRHRGGNGAELAVIPHKTELIHWATVSGAVAVPAPGLFGGYPAATNKFQLVRGARIPDQLRRSGRMPVTLDDIAEGDREWVEAKSFDRTLGVDDLWITAWAGGAGYGDPLDRDPGAVQADIAAGRTTPEWARRAYGVVATAAAVDHRATSELRGELRWQRLAEAQPWSGDAGDDHGADGATMSDRRLSDELRVESGDIYAGTTRLGPAGRNYKLGALIRDLPLTEANPHIRPPEIHTDHQVTFRQIICPGTGQLLQTEIAVDGAPPRWDLRPHLPEDEVVVGAPGVP